MKILIVEDEIAAGVFLKLCLEQEGFEVCATTSSAEAFRAAEEFFPDVLISDYQLREALDGLDVSKRLAELFPNLRTIIVTGMPEGTISIHETNTPRLIVLIKPLDCDLVANRIRGLMEQRCAAESK
jgi:two-component system OmpR family response regulator